MGLEWQWVKLEEREKSSSSPTKPHGLAWGHIMSVGYYKKHRIPKKISILDPYISPHEYFFATMYSLHLF